MPTAYFAVVHDTSIQFIRNTRKHSIELLMVKNDGVTAAELVTDFCRRLKNDYSYYGQPFAVLLDNHHAFTYIRKFEALAPVHLHDQLKRLQNDRSVLNYTTRQVANASLLVAQGIDKEYLAHLTQSFETYDVPVTMITTLSSYLALYADLTTVVGPSMNILVWSETEYSYLGTNSKGAIFSGVSIGNALTEEEIELPIDSLLADVRPDAITKFSLGGGSSKDSFPLSKLSRRGHNANRRHFPVLKPVSTSRLSRAVVVAQNSLKLLLLVLLILFAVSGTVALVSMSRPAADSRFANLYQDLYIRKYSLERERDSLDALASQQVTRAGKSQNAAALVSLFCQSKPYGLALNSISIRRSGTDSVVVEVAGTSKTETGIFTYNQQLNTLSDPIPVTIGSFRPEIVAVGGQPDTVLSFKLSMVFNEQADRQ